MTTTTGDHTSNAAAAFGGNSAIRDTPRAFPGSGTQPGENVKGVHSRWARVLLRCRSALGWDIRMEALHHVPRQGGALLVANHASPSDARMLASVLPRQVLFVSEEDPAASRFLPASSGYLRKLILPRHASPRERRERLKAASEAIRDGHLVCLFAEGQVSRTGQMLPFGTDSEEILKGLMAPIIPVGITTVPLRGWRWWRKEAWAQFGAPLPATTSAVEVRAAVQEAASEAWRRRAQECDPLHRAFRRTARRHPLRFAMSDARVPRLGFLAALAGAIHLARKLRRHWADEDKVGILLPPSVAGGLVNLAALLAGKVTVNLNYTCSTQTLESCITQCGIRTVVTSELFLQKAKVQLPCPSLALEDVVGKASARERIVALAMGVLLPASWLERALGRSRSAGPEEIATIIFSSGSTGEPKGVVLTHANVAANIAQLAQVYRPTSRDRMLGVLPFFHSFGYTATLCLPATCGMGVAYYPTPLDAAAVGRLVREHALTFLLGTPTFLQLYLNTCAPADFGSLRVVMAAAEKLPDRVAAAFEDKFGIRPLEGYGCTECAPAVAVNTHDHRAPGLRQVGSKRGSIGHPLPGIAVRIVDPVTEEPLPPGQPGLLLVSGPNVMQGYLGRPDLTARVLRDGWYVTGDIAAMDDDGFLRITDRLSRFSKIGGEMVPHLRVEERLHALASADHLTFVVTSVPDERKGERLVVLHTLAEPTLRTCLDRLTNDDLPNLWKPKPAAFFRVESFPQLGSGKLDLVRIKELARSFAS
jgi:acyl-[acyl-carrier-protein]-phospholipid O-acyltransferase/long-chain-fatty-acid--[acyl-carrier-protein] ligase